ncbi:MAG: hypothetical protein H7338_12595, partial [Candidatus Sericytochromatia bacterium]|nr:hypothetical protein [Candidatus Sericytochromatia bacterium]
MQRRPFILMGLAMFLAACTASVRIYNPGAIPVTPRGSARPLVAATALQTLIEGDIRWGGRPLTGAEVRAEDPADLYREFRSEPGHSDDGGRFRLALNETVRPHQVLNLVATKGELQLYALWRPVPAGPLQVKQRAERVLISAESTIIAKCLIPTLLPLLYSNPQSPAVLPALIELQDLTDALTTRLQGADLDQDIAGAQRTVTTAPTTANWNALIRSIVAHSAEGSQIVAAVERICMAVFQAMSNGGKAVTWLRWSIGGRIIPAPEDFTVTPTQHRLYFRGQEISITSTAGELESVRQRIREALSLMGNPFDDLPFATPS